MGGHFDVKVLFRDGLYFFSPLLIAVAARCVIAFLLRVILDMPFHSGGATGIGYEESSLAYLLGSNGFRYFVAGLVYFPITEFVVASVVFAIFVCCACFKKQRWVILLLGFFVFISLFALTILQGCCMQYRTAQSLTVFMALTAFLLCEYFPYNRRLVACCFLFLCWHQAVYLNRVLSFNNMRSNNEAATLGYIGNRLVSEFRVHDRPVVFLTDDDYYGGYLGPWISKRVYANLDTWNGRLFNEITHRYLPETYHHYKFLNSNVINATAVSFTMKRVLEYYGFEIQAQPLSAILQAEKKHAETATDSTAI